MIDKIPLQGIPLYGIMKIKAHTMAIRSFRDKDIENFFLNEKVGKKIKWAFLASIAKRKLDMLHYAKDLMDLRSPPSNCLESLKGNLNGYYSIRINIQWRIVFKWDNQPYDVDIVDYH